MKGVRSEYRQGLTTFGTHLVCGDFAERYQELPDDPTERLSVAYRMGMRRHWAWRPLTAFVGLWFLVAGRELPIAHQCHMPSALPVAAGGGHDHDVHADVHQHVLQNADTKAPQHAPELAPHHAQQQSAPQNTEPPTSPSRADCDCVGTCCSVATSTLGLAPEPAQATPILASAVTAPRGALPRAVQPLHYRQPFAIGPPLRTTA